MTAIAPEAQLTSAASVAQTVAASSAATQAESVAQTVAASAAATVAATTAQSVQGVPDKYDLKLPANAKFDPAIVERTAAIARERGLGNDAAQTALDTAVALVAERDTALVEAWQPGGKEWKKRDAEWAAESLANKEIGGTPEKLATSIELANKVRTALGDKELDTFLIQTGLGSHPAVLKFLAKIGKSMSESTLVAGTPAAVNGKLPMAVAMYGVDGTGKPKPQE